MRIKIQYGKKIKENLKNKVPLEIKKLQKTAQISVKPHEYLQASKNQITCRGSNQK